MFPSLQLSGISEAEEVISFRKEPKLMKVVGNAEVMFRLGSMGNGG